MVEKMTKIAVALKNVASGIPDQDALVFEDSTFSYAQLWKLIESFAVLMRELGVDRNSIIAIDSKDTLVILGSLFASSLLGSKWTPKSDDLKRTDLQSATHIFHALDTADNAVEASILIDGSWSPAFQKDSISAKAEFDDAGDPEAPWMLLHTSGTTGNPKYLGLSERVVFDRSIAVRNDFIAGETKFCSLFPSDSRPFLARAIAALLHGCTIVESLKFSFWQEADVNMVCGSRSQVMDILGDSVIFPKSPLLEVSGSKILDSDCKILLNSFERLIDIYGASETNKTFANVKTIGPEGTVNTKGSRLDSQVEIRDANNKLCATQEDGVVRIKNGYMIDGYLNDPEAGKRAFRNGWFYSGDIAHWGENGELNVFGRVDHVINLGGVKIDALLVDSVLASTDGISDAVCFKNPKDGALDELFAFVVLDGSVNQLQAIASAQYNCRDQLNEKMVPRIIRPIDNVPRNTNGAPIRTVCEAMVLERVNIRAAEKMA